MKVNYYHLYHITYLLFILLLFTEMYDSKKSFNQTVMIKSKIHNDKIGVPENGFIYKIGFYYKLDYQTYTRKKQKLRFDLGSSKYHKVYFDDHTNTIIYKKGKTTEKTNICDITNVKFMWDIGDLKSRSFEYNKSCLILFDKKIRNGFLICASNIESKILFLNLIYANVEKCSPKLGIFNKKELLKQRSQILNSIMKNKKHPFKKNEIESKSNHYVYFNSYTFFDKEAFLFKRKLGLNEINKSYFKKVNLTITDIDIRLDLLNPTDNMKNFLENNKNSQNIEEEVKINFDQILCDYLGTTSFFIESEARRFLLSDILTSLPTQIFNGYCWTINPCKADYQYLICFENEKFYLRFKDSFVNTCILYHFTKTWEHKWDHLNNDSLINTNIDHFVHQNFANYTAEIKKSNEILKDNPDFNRNYKTYKYFFKKPVSDKILFINEIVDAYKEKSKEKYEELCTQIQQLNDTAKSIDLLDKFDEDKYKLDKKKIIKMAGILL